MQMLSMFAELQEINRRTDKTGWLSCGPPYLTSERWGTIKMQSPHIQINQIILLCHQNTMRIPQNK